MCSQRGGRVRKGKIEAKVKVTSPLVDAVSGRTPATPQTEAETTYITFLFGFFVLIITEGLTLAASVSGVVKGCMCVRFHAIH